MNFDQLGVGIGEVLHRVLYFRSNRGFIGLQLLLSGNFVEQKLELSALARLFGGGAGACVLKPVAGKRGILSDYIHAQGHFGDLMMVVAEERDPLDQQTKMITLPHIAMQGQELFKVAVNSLAAAVGIAVKKAGLKLSDIDYVVPHQANDRIISAVARKLHLPKEKIFINIDRYGNMSAASIAVALYEAVERKKIKRGDYVVLVTFGAGLVSAANVVKW